MVEIEVLDGGGLRIIKSANQIKVSDIKKISDSKSAIDITLATFDDKVQAEKDALLAQIEDRTSRLKAKLISEQAELAEILQKAVASGIQLPE